MVNRVKTFIKNLYSRLSRPFILLLQGIKPPGFKGASLHEIGVIFLGYVLKPRFGLYAGALSFNFFIALFPSIIFLFTLVAYVPIEHLDTQVLEIMEKFMPDSAFEMLSATVADIIRIQRGGLLSFGFISALFFASNGFYNMIIAFDSSLESDIRRERNYFTKWFTSIMLTFLVSLLLILSIVVLIASGYISIQMSQWGIDRDYMNTIRKVVEVITLSGLVFFIISFIYYLAPSHKIKWQLFSPGSIVATTLSLLSTYLFTSYVNNFNTYNKLYGSIGAIVAIMLLIYVNVYAILTGFELNHSINKASHTKS